MWMLTGDKGVTAKTIGFTCRLYHKSMKIYEVEDDSLQNDLDEMHAEVVGRGAGALI